MTKFTRGLILETVLVQRRIPNQPGESERAVHLEQIQLTFGDRVYKPIPAFPCSAGNVFVSTTPDDTVQSVIPKDAVAWEGEHLGSGSPHFYM